MCQLVVEQLNKFWELNKKYTRGGQFLAAFKMPTAV